MKRESMLELYHGTTADSADRLLRDGWGPGSHPSGNHCGDPRFLYLTNAAENALWYAQEKGCETVLRVMVDIEDLRVDPEDGCHETVLGELGWLSGLPGSVVATASLSPSAFSLVDLSPDGGRTAPVADDPSFP